jgi:predicted dehydrogenase
MIVGVIGTGVMGKNHIRVYLDLKGVDEVCTYDIDDKAIPGTTKYEDLDNLLHHVDAVSICVPTKHHFNTLSKVIVSNVDVLVEKPVCTTVNEAINLPDKKDLIVGVGHIERFNPVITEISRIVKKPLYVEFKRHNPTSQRVTDTTVVEDLMIHDIDIIQHVLFDTLQDITAIGSQDVASVQGKFWEVPIHLSASRKASKKVRKVYIEEEDLTIEGDLMTQEVYVYHKPEDYQFVDRRYSQENVIEKIAMGKVEPLKVELQTFLECVRTRKPFPVTFKQAIKNVVTCEIIRRQLNGSN